MNEQAGRFLSSDPSSLLPSPSWSGASSLVLFSSPSDSAEDTLCPCFTPPSCRMLPFSSHLYSCPLRLFLPRRSVCWRLFKGLFNSFVRSLSLSPLNMIHHTRLPSASPSFSFIPFLLSYFSPFTWKTAPSSLTCSVSLAKTHFLNIKHFLGLQAGISFFFFPAIKK